MPPQRTIDAGARWGPYRHPGHVPQPQPAQPPKPKQKRHAHTADEWEALYGVIEKLYREEDKKVEEVVNILKTEYKFGVCKRKLLDWMKTKGIVKNESKANMQILYAKRQGRLMFQGKKTVIFKDGRVLEDDRLDRWGIKFAAELDLHRFQDAATPDHYTVATPQATTSLQEPHVCKRESLNELFVAEKPVQTAYGLVFDNISTPEPSSHDHQLGILGLRMITEVPEINLSILMRKSLILARDLVNLMLGPASHKNVYYASTRPTPNARVPKVRISYTGYSQKSMDRSIETRIVAMLQNSTTLMQLLQLSSGDRSKWQRDWYAMTLEEQLVVESLCTTFFGSLSSFNPALEYIHITILLESPGEPANTVLTRVSLGIDTRLVPECERCQRRVVSVDSINEKGAVKLNVPLQSTWKSNWEPDSLVTVVNSETARWDDYVYALRGWFKSTTRCALLEESDGEHEGEATWDPMDAMNPLATFQPREAAVPVGCCAYNDLSFVCQCIPAVKNTSVFDPFDAEDAFWDPDDSLHATTDQASVVFSEEEFSNTDF